MFSDSEKSPVSCWLHRKKKKLKKIVNKCLKKSKVHKMWGLIHCVLLTCVFWITAQTHKPFLESLIWYKPLLFLNKALFEEGTTPLLLPQWYWWGFECHQYIINTSHTCFIIFDQSLDTYGNLTSYEKQAPVRGTADLCMWMRLTKEITVVFECSWNCTFPA